MARNLDIYARGVVFKLFFQQAEQLLRHTVVVNGLRKVFGRRGTSLNGLENG